MGPACAALSISSICRWLSARTRFATSTASPPSTLFVTGTGWLMMVMRIVKRDATSVAEGITTSAAKPASFWFTRASSWG